MAPSSELKELVHALPEANKKGMLHDIKEGQVEGVVDTIHAGGRKNIVGLIDMIKEPGAGDDYKQWYALQVLAVRLCDPKDKTKQTAFADILAAELGGDRPAGVRTRLIRLLQVCGSGKHAPAIGKALGEKELCEPAAQALLSIGDGAVEQFRAALPKLTGGCRLTVIQALGVLRDTQSAPALREALGDNDRAIRLAAAWGLANMGDADSTALLLKAADAAGWERIKATKACLLLAERLAAAGKKDAAGKIYTHLKKTRTDPSERYVAEAATAGQAAL